MYRENREELEKIAKAWYKDKKKVVGAGALAGLGFHTAAKHIGPINKLTTGVNKRLGETALIRGAKSRAAKSALGKSISKTRAASEKLISGKGKKLFAKTVKKMKLNKYEAKAAKALSNITKGLNSAEQKKVLGSIIKAIKFL